MSSKGLIHNINGPIEKRTGYKKKKKKGKNESKIDQSCFFGLNMSNAFIDTNPKRLTHTSQQTDTHKNATTP